MGDCEEAEESYGRALALVPEASDRWFVLRRNVLETRLFKGEQPTLLMDPFDELLSQVRRASGSHPTSRKLQSALAQILRTTANVYLQAGRLAEEVQRDPVAALPLLERAREYFEEAVRDSSEKWAKFGLAETLFKLGSLQQDEELLARARALYLDDVRRVAVHEYTTREEPRSKLLGHITELVCCVRTGTDYGTALAQSLEALGRVDPRLWVYSQVQNRNVSREEFRRDLERLVPSIAVGPVTDPAAMV